jgi:hypothetical protein
LWLLFSEEVDGPPILGGSSCTTDRQVMEQVGVSPWAVDFEYGENLGKLDADSQISKTLIPLLHSMPLVRCGEVPRGGSSKNWNQVCRSRTNSVFPATFNYGHGSQENETASEVTSPLAAGDTPTSRGMLRNFRQDRQRTPRWNSQSRGFQNNHTSLTIIYFGLFLLEPNPSGNLLFSSCEFGRAILPSVLVCRSTVADLHHADSLRSGYPETDFQSTSSYLLQKLTSNEHYPQ